MSDSRYRGILKRIKNREERLAKINSLLENESMMQSLKEHYVQEKVKLIGELAECYMIKRDMEDEMKENEM